MENKALVCAEKAAERETQGGDKLGIEKRWQIVYMEVCTRMKEEIHCFKRTGFYLWY